MSSIGGPGGIGGPNPPGGPAALDSLPSPDAPESTGAVGSLDQREATPATSAAALAERPHAASSLGATDVAKIDQVFAEISAGRITPNQAIDQLVEITASPELGVAERAELRALLDDLIAHDPYLQSLVGRV